MRILVVRIGAFGDCIIVTPFIKFLKQKGNEIYVLTSEAGMQIYANNPYIDKLIYYDNKNAPSTIYGALGDYFYKVAQDHKCEKVVDLCESIEVSLARCTHDPCYMYSKAERRRDCDKNYYAYTFEYGGYDCNGEILRGELFFTEKEEQDFMNFRKDHLGFQLILWGLSGSGRNKTYPFMPYIVGDIMRHFKKVKVITVGDESCQILEAGLPNHPRIIKKSGKWSFRQSMLATKYVDLVVSPDTGLLHAAGMFPTPKIGLLGHSTIKNITKTFLNDFSIEAQCSCAPCFRIIEEAATQCPIDVNTKACMCMSKEAMPPELIFEKISNILNGRYSLSSL